MENTIKGINPHYNYDIQAWVDERGIILKCGHRKIMDSCTACEFAGRNEEYVVAVRS